MEKESREIAQTINLLRFHLKCRQIAGIFDIKAGQRQSQNAVQIIEKSEEEGGGKAHYKKLRAYKYLI